MRLFLTVFREYPRRSTLVVLCLTLAALAGGVGMSSMLPLLSLLTKSDAQGAAAAEPPGEFEQRVLAVIDAMGLDPSLGVLLAIMVTAMIVKGAMTLLSKRQVGYAVAQVATDLRLSLLDALMLSRWSYLIRQPVGALTTSFSSEADRGSMAYLHATTIVQLVMQTVAFAAIALAVSWQATLAAAGVGLVILYGLSSLVRMTRRAGIKQTRITRRAMARLTDTLQALKPLKAMARERLIGPLLADDTRRLNAALRKLVLSKESLRAIQEPLTFSFLALGVYAAVGVWDMPVANVVLLGFLFWRTLNSLGRAQRQYQSMVSQEPAFWSIRATVAKARSERESTLGRTIPKLERAISLRGVNLSYGETKVLSDVSLEIPAGQITGLVGPSGGGKTSIGDLVVGLLRPDSGEIFIDELPLAEVDIQRWRGSIGYVPQEMFLLHDSVRQNVILGDQEIEPAQIERALRRAGAADFVAALPEGIDSTIGERGALLSGGQRQRIAIARALVHEPTLLLLDEATAALDPETEKALWESLVRLKGEVTVLAISHQPALFSAADRIYRIENGKATRVSDTEAPTALVVA